MNKKPEKTPQERGLTASTDLRIVRRVAGIVRSPAAIYSTDVAYMTASPPPPPAPSAQASQQGSIWGIYAGSSQAPPTPPAPPLPGGVPPLQPRQPAAAPAPPIVAATGNTFHLSAGSITITAVEFVLQQCWYGPYGDPEWHDIQYVDLIPKDIG